MRDLQQETLRELKKSALRFVNLIRVANGRAKLKALPKGKCCGADDDSLCRALRTKAVAILVGSGDVYAPGLTGQKFVKRTIKNAGKDSMISLGADGNSIMLPATVALFLNAYDDGQYPELVVKQPKPLIKS